VNERANCRTIGPALALILFMSAFAACAAGGSGAAGKDAAAGKSAAADTSVAAEIGGQKITIQEMDDYLRKVNPRAFQEFYDARKAALDGLIAERLIAAEAATRSTTPDKLRQEIGAAVPVVTDMDVQGFYTQNQARMGGRTLDQVKDQIRGFLAGQKQQQAMSDFISGLKDKKGVRIYLDVPRAEVRIAETDPAKGPKNAPVQIVEFSDFQ